MRGAAAGKVRQLAVFNVKGDAHVTLGALLEQLHQLKEAGIEHSAPVFFDVPGGGDYSNCRSEIAGVSIGTRVVAQCQHPYCDHEHVVEQVVLRAP